jgi:hypothetical protein
MAMRSSLLLALLTVAGCTSPPSDPPPDIAPAAATETPEETLARVQELAQRLCDATREGRYGVVADLTYPKLVEMVGGRQRLIDGMRSEFTAPGAPRLLEMTSGEPLPVQGFGEYQVTFVPTATTIAADAKKFRGHTHMLAISSDGGGTWHFMSGNKQSHARIRVFIPEFPDSIPLPENEPLEVLAE